MHNILILINVRVVLIFWHIATLILLLVIDRVGAANLKLFIDEHWVELLYERERGGVGR
jgi:hypothetical protein